MPPVILSLGMNLWVAVDLRGRRLENACFGAFCQTKHVYGTHHRGLHRFNGIVLVVNGRRGTGQIINLINLQLDWINDIVPKHLKMLVPHEVLNIFAPPSEKIIEAKNLMTRFNHTITEVTPKKTRSSGD